MNSPVSIAFCTFTRGSTPPPKKGQVDVPHGTGIRAPGPALLPRLSHAPGPRGAAEGGAAAGDAALAARGRRRGGEGPLPGTAGRPGWGMGRTWDYVDLMWIYMETWRLSHWTINGGNI